MKNPIKKHLDQEKRLDEIFGKIAKFFSGSDDTDNDKYTVKSSKYKDLNLKLTNKEKSDVEQKMQADYLSKIEKYRSSVLLNPDECDKDKKGKSNAKRAKVRFNPEGYIMIDDDKIIKDFSELYIENLSNNKGTGSFRKLNVRDLVCYDLREDNYGIAWLLDPYSSYIAEKISGKLFFNKINQSVNFEGHWQTGKFYGRISGTQALNRLKTPSSKQDVLDKFSKLKDLIISTKNNFDKKFPIVDFTGVGKKVEESNDPKLAKLFPEILKIKNSLASIDTKKGMGTSSYVRSNELYKIKSRIDNNDNQDEIILDIDDLYKYYLTINSKIDNFWNRLYQSTVQNPQPKQGKKFKKLSN